MARTYKRDRRGRFAGSGGGSSSGSSVGGSRVKKTTRKAGARPTTKSSQRGPRRPTRKGTLGARAKKAATNKKVQAAVAVGVVGIGANVAYNKVNPATSLRKSGIEVPGAITSFGGTPKKPEYTVVKGNGRQFTTYTSGKGRKKVNTTIVENVKGKKVTPIGYVISQQKITGGGKVTHTYLTGPNRGKGIGKQALAAHAAHRPNQKFRADPSRSISGQGLANSVGVGKTRRSKKSKADPLANTRVLNSDWRTTTRATLAESGSIINTNIKGMKGRKVVAPSKKARRVGGRKLKR